MVRGDPAMSLDRYRFWCNQNRIRHIDHGRWLHLTDHQLAVVVTVTPPMSRNYTLSCLLRVTDPTLPILVESFNTPFGELYASADNGHTRLGVRTWVTDGGTIRLAQPIRPE